jgi:hypothetical protein
LDKRRVIWEFEWDDDELEMVKDESLEGRYFTSPKPHHQGMFMATPQQLIHWKTRPPDCHFAKVQLRPAYHRERTSGAMDLFDAKYCNVTQLLPLDGLEDLLIHHMPNTNHQRMPYNILSTRELHNRRLRKMQSDKNRKIVVDHDKGEYNGIRIILDERDPQKSLHFDLTEYGAYVASGGRLTEQQLERHSDLEDSISSADSDSDSD